MRLDGGDGGRHKVGRRGRGAGREATGSHKTWQSGNSYIFT